MTDNAMKLRKHPTMRATWGLALVIPVLAGGGAWLVSEATVSTDACRTGSSGHFGGASEVVLLALLLLAAPTTIVWHARGAGRFRGHVVGPAVISTLLAVLFVFLGVQLWWYGHSCYS